MKNNNNENNSPNEFDQNLNNNENNQDKNKRVYSKSRDNKILIFSVAIGVGLFVIPVILGLTLNMGSKLKHIDKDYDEYEDYDYEDENEEEDEEEWKTPTGNAGEINIYESEDKKFLETFNSGGKKPKYTYACQYSTCTADEIYSDLGYAIIKDLDYVLYDLKNNKYKKINLKNNDDWIFDVGLIYYDKTVYGYAVKNGGSYAIYNLKNEKLVTDYKYNERFYDGNPELKDGNLILEDEEKHYIIDFNTGEVLAQQPKDKREPDEGNIEDSIIAENYKNKTYYLKKHYISDPSYNAYLYELLDKNLNKIIDEKFKKYTIDEDGNIVVKTSDTNFSIYNNDGKLLKTSKTYKKIISIDHHKYVSVIDNDNFIKIIDLEGKEIAKVVEATDNIIVHEYLSGWNKASWWNTEANKEGIYIVVEDKSVNIGTKGRAVEYMYDPNAQVTRKNENESIYGLGKPVLYLYPKKNNTKVTVTFDKPELLSTTYPKYKGKWQVTADKNGNLLDSNNKEYYALYWDELTYKKQSFETGFYVTKDNAIDFLEEKLTKIGLNNRERNEFIMYWLPILEKNEKSLVYFELTESRQQFNKINITPKPDSLLRVAIHIKKVDKKVNIKEQKLPKFKRKGFTAVEWGGVNY